VSGWHTPHTDGVLSCRTVTFVQQVESRLTPVKETRVRESQRCKKFDAGRLVLVAKIALRDVPFKDHFRVYVKWILTPRGAEACLLALSFQVVFLQSTWFKGQIESNVKAETRQKNSACIPLIRRLVGTANGGAAGAASSIGAAPMPLAPAPSPPPIVDLAAVRRAAPAAFASAGWVLAAMLLLTQLEPLADAARSATGQHAVGSRVAGGACAAVSPSLQTLRKELSEMEGTRQRLGAESLHEHRIERSSILEPTRT
jgi:hypothetical protein